MRTKRQPKKPPERKTNLTAADAELIAYVVRDIVREEVSGSLRGIVRGLEHERSTVADVYGVDSRIMRGTLARVQEAIYSALPLAQVNTNRGTNGEGQAS